MLKITEQKKKKKRGDQKENLAPCLAITIGCCVSRERAREDGGLVEGDPFPIRVSPQAFNHPIKRIFTYVN